MKKKYLVGIAVFFASFVLTLQVKNTLLGKSNGAIEHLRLDQIQTMLHEQQQKNEVLRRKVTEYEQQINAYIKQADEIGGYTQLLKEKYETALISAGLTDVVGSGVIVTVSDSTKENTTGQNENNFIVHDEDLLRVINELRDAGAEALSLNGERILATSEIRCSGSTVSINNTRYTAPFIIRAIGPADEMQRVLTMRQGVVEVLATWGIGVDVKKVDNLEIGAYNGLMEFQYAKGSDEE